MAKVRHYDSDEVRRYIAKQKADRKKQQQQEKERQQAENEKKLKQLEELRKKQKETAKVAKMKDRSHPTRPDLVEVKHNINTLSTKVYKIT